MAWIKIFCVFLGTGKFAAIRLVFSIIIMIASSIIIIVIVSSVIIVLIVSSIIATLPPPISKNKRSQLMKNTTVLLKKGTKQLIALEIQLKNATIKNLDVSGRKIL